MESIQYDKHNYRELQKAKATNNTLKRELSSHTEVLHQVLDWYVIAHKEDIQGNLTLGDFPLQSIYDRIDTVYPDDLESKKED